jgi:uncharacterized membrane protein YfcA
VPLVIFVGYLVFGITGFGASPITIPVLVHLLPGGWRREGLSLFNHVHRVQLGTRRDVDGG